LVRWHTRSAGLLGRWKFIDIAEETA